MKNLLSPTTLMLFTVSSMLACSHKPPVSGSTPVVVEAHKLGAADGNTSDVANGDIVAAVVTAPIDPAVLKKAKPLLEAIAKDDDKKAKLAYGRAVRVLPEVLQFAVDLRFKNYQHALVILQKTSLSKEQKDFWQHVVEMKPPRLAVALCNELVDHPEFPANDVLTPQDESAWTAELNKETQALVSANKTRSDLNQRLDKVICDSSNCPPMSEELQADLLTDSFFDQLHNMKRRDTRFWQSQHKNILKLAQYSPYVSDMALLKFYRALKATPGPKQNHFLRRFHGVARDMRAETILSRSIAATILGDDKDKALAKRLGLFLTSNSLISAVTRVEGEIPGCHLPELKPTSPPPVAPTAAVSPAPSSSPTPSEPAATATAQPTP